MYNGKKILAFIPARFGSKGIPHKNLKIIKNKPLFMHSVDCAFSSKYIDDVLVSSDSLEILDLAHRSGSIPNKQRPAELSDDKSRIIDAMLWELEQTNTKYDVIILLQPTYPIRPDGIIDSAIEKYFETETSLITVVKTDTPPEFIRYIENGKLQKIIKSSADIRRQDFPSYYKIIGSIYINNAKNLSSETVLNENQIPYLIENEYDLDIDSDEDWKKLERHWAEKGQ